MLYQIDISEDQQRVIQTIGDKIGYSVQEAIQQIVQDTVDSLKFSHVLFHDEVEPSCELETQSVLALGAQGRGKTVLIKSGLLASKSQKERKSL